MRARRRNIIFALLLQEVLLLPLVVLAADAKGNFIHIGATAFALFNLLLFITSIISLRQLFWPAYRNHLPFQAIHFFLGTLFYAVSLAFLVHYRAYYQGYEHLMPIEVIARFFLHSGIRSIGQWLIVVSLVLNVVYVIRYYRDYFEAGIAAPPPHDANAHSNVESVNEP